MLLASRARHASDGRLVLDTAGGLVVGALLVAFRPPAWPVFLSAALVFLAFGVWGISDRALGDGALGPRMSRTLRALRLFAAGLGVAGALALIATGMAVMLGTWIS